MTILKKYPAVLLLLMLPVVLTTLVTACSDSEPSQPTPRVILIQGACSSSELNDEPDHWVQTVTRILTEDYGFTDAPTGDPSDQVIEFGYSASGWSNKYLPADTLKSIHESSAGLKAIYDYYPDSQFFILGHSLGGIVALDGVARYSNADNQVTEHTGGIITVSSPVKGLNQAAAGVASFAIELIVCGQLPQGDRSPVWSDLESSGDPIALIHGADWSGVQVTNFANRQDRVVNWQQAVLDPPFDAACYDVGSGGLLDLNHDTLLRDADLARELIAVLFGDAVTREECVGDG